MTLGQANDRTTERLQREMAPKDPDMVMTPNWSPNIGVHKVSWNNSNGIHNAGWLASGTASGLGRVEWVQGRFSGDKVLIDDEVMM